MRTLSTILTVAATLVIAGNLSAAEKKAALGKKPHRVAEWKAPAWLANLSLTAEQKEKIQAAEKELAPKREAIIKKMQGILTPEQKQCKAEASKKAKAEGKSAKETRELVEAAVKPSDKQKAEMVEVSKEMGAVGKELREKIMPLLTDEQKAQLKKAHASHKKSGHKERAKK